VLRFAFLGPSFDVGKGVGIGDHTDHAPAWTFGGIYPGGYWLD
jgi:hypothetical protein